MLDTFPEAFKPGRRRPLKLGIRQDILAHPKLPAYVTPESLRKALAKWVGHDLYLLAMSRPRTRRIALDGTKLDPVSDEHAADAMAVLRARKAARGEGRWRRWEREAQDAPEAVVIRTRRPDDWRPPLRRVY